MFRQISEANLERAIIADLSACSTAENRTVQLVDEVIHLASGFRVASMWASNDKICVDMTKEFYERLQGHAGGKGTLKDIAETVHDSVLEVRSKLRKMPLSWVPYIHLGA
jgi:hypothetical protein